MLREVKDGVIVEVYVKPCAKREGFRLEDVLVFETREKPVKGRVNRALVKALAKLFKVSPSRIEITSGLRSRDKIVLVKDISLSEAKYILSKNLRRES